jgi:hypothetical protein
MSQCEFRQTDEFMSLYNLLVQFPICRCAYFVHFWRSEGGRTVLFVSELVLMCLEVHKEDLFALFLHCLQLHCSMEAAVVEVAK